MIAAATRLRHSVGEVDNLILWWRTCFGLYFDDAVGPPCSYFVLILNWGNCDCCLLRYALRIEPAEPCVCFQRHISVENAMFLRSCRESAKVNLSLEGTMLTGVDAVDAIELSMITLNGIKRVLI